MLVVRRMLLHLDRIRGARGPSRERDRSLSWVCNLVHRRRDYPNGYRGALRIADRTTIEARGRAPFC